MQSNSLKPILVYLGAMLLAYLTGQLLISSDYGLLFGGLLAIFGMVFGLTAKVEFLLYLTFYILVAGSSYDMRIRDQVFYVRFALFAIYVLRYLPYCWKIWQQRQAAPQLAQARVLHWTMFHTLVLGYLFLAYCSYVYSVDPMLSLQRAIAISTMFGAIFLYLYEVSDSWQKMADYMRVMAKATFLLLMVGFLFYLLGIGSGTQSTGRLRLFLFGPNELGYICAILFPACFWYYAEASTRSQKIFAWCGVVLNIAALILTASRGSLVCFLVSGFLQVVLAYRKRLVLYLAGAFLALSLTYIFAPPKTDRLMEVFEKNIVRSESLESGSGRLPIWQHSLELAAERPWFGYGFGTVNTLFMMGYFSSALGSFQGASLHNSYLELLLDLGYTGVTLLSLGLLIIFIRGLRALRAVWGTPQQNFVVMVFCCFFSGVTSAVFESWMTSPGSVFSFPFWYCGALLIRMPTLFQTAGDLKPLS